VSTAGVLGPAATGVVPGAPARAGAPLPRRLRPGVPDLQHGRRVRRQRRRDWVARRDFAARGEGRKLARQS